MTINISSKETHGVFDKVKYYRYLVETTHTYVEIKFYDDEELTLPVDDFDSVDVRNF